MVTGISWVDKILFSRFKGFFGRINEAESGRFQV